MRASSSLIAAFLAALPLAAAASRGQLGFSLGTKNPGGSCKDQKAYEADFDAIAKHTDSRIVRGYAAADCDFAKLALPAAKAKGFKVILGIWPDVETSFNNDKAAIVEHAPKFKDQVYAITVGSETLYRGNFTGSELLEKIQNVKKDLPDFKVGTADSWNKFDDGTADDLIRGKPDILLVNAFAFWQGQKMDNATHTYFEDLSRAFTHIQKLAGSDDAIELWNGETGWPTAQGSDYHDAKGGLQNAEAYWKSAICGARAWGINLFYFEAFDESWKPHSTGDSGLRVDETSWGLFKHDRTLKFDPSCPGQ